MSDPRAGLLHRVRCIFMWTIGTLAFIDATVGLFFRAPADPFYATRLQTYFEDGRSIEGKLRRYVGSSPGQDAMIVRAGWLSDCDNPSVARLDKQSFDIYGMSFSDRVADHLEQLDSTLVGRRFGGPAAPLNHSYACYVHRAQSDLAHAPIQILGILASSLPRIETLSGLTTSFDVPEPFTYPRFYLDKEGRLVARWPSIRTREDLRAALANPQKWQIFIDELRRYDFFFAPELFQSDIFDYSVLGRLIRRAWEEHVIRVRTDALRAANEKSGAPDFSSVLVAMLLDFAATSRSAGQHPIVILFEDKGYGTMLSALVAPALRANHIDYVATSEIASPADVRNFSDDGHFIRTVDEKIARAVLGLIKRSY